MLTKPRFPSISEFLSRVIKSIIAFYQNPNVVVYWQSVRVTLPAAEVAFSVHRLNQPATGPNIVYTGNRVTKETIYKIASATQPGGFRYELRAEIPRTVFIRLPLAGGNEGKVFLEAIRLWDMLHAMSSIRHDIWMQMGVFNPRLDATPVQDDSGENVIIHGAFNCEIRIPFTRNAGVIVSGNDFGLSNADQLAAQGIITSGFESDVIWSQLTSDQAGEITVGDEFLFTTEN